MKKLKLVWVFLLGILMFSSVAVGSFNQISSFNLEQVEFVSQVNNGYGSDDFYFVHLTDTHIMHKLFDPMEATKKRLVSVIENVTSFDEKPAFIVITGDLVEWGGGRATGALNCQAFVDCFYEKDDQLYADAGYSIPVYTTPGNHDYCFNRNLNNYHTYIDKNHIADEDRYIITYNDLSLFFMDSGPNYYENPFDWFDVMGDGLYDDDIDWLEDVLSSCTTQYKIVLMHHPAINDRNNVGEMHNVIARNREEFVNLCETYDVDLVLAGHTHRSVIFDSDENKSYHPPLNCNQYPTLYVQSDDCKEEVHYRNISFIDNDLWIEGSKKINITSGEVAIVASNLENIDNTEIVKAIPECVPTATTTIRTID